MALIKNILGRIFALWAMLVFTVTLFIIIIPVCFTFLLKEPAGTEVYRRITKIWMQVFLTLSGCFLSVKGKHNFAKGKTYVVACNHNSLMDIPLTTPFVPGANKTIGKKSFAKTPVFGWVYIRGSVLVDRSSDESRRRSFEEMRRTLQHGLHMVIYPEGTRNRTADPLKSFFDGAFKLAVDSEKEIIPAIIFNTRRVLPPGKPFFFWPHRLHMHFLPPVPVKNTTTKQLKEEVFKIMWDYYLQNSRKF